MLGYKLQQKLLGVDAHAFSIHVLAAHCTERKIANNASQQNSQLPMVIGTGPSIKRNRLQITFLLFLRGRFV